MRFLLWSGVEKWLTEAASVELAEGCLRASGIQLGADPAPFRVDYRLEAPEMGSWSTTPGWRGAWSRG